MQGVREGFRGSTGGGRGSTGGVEASLVALLLFAIQITSLVSSRRRPAVRPSATGGPTAVSSFTHSLTAQLSVPKHPRAEQYTARVKSSSVRWAVRTRRSVEPSAVAQRRAANLSRSDGRTLHAARCVFHAARRVACVVCCMLRRCHAAWNAWWTDERNVQPRPPPRFPPQVEPCGGRKRMINL